MTVTPSRPAVDLLAAAPVLAVAGPDLPSSGVATSVVVPTRNEARNVDELLRRLDQAFGDHDVEVLFVDDSTDETPHVIARAAATSRRDIRLIHRPAGQRADGLGGAVLAGLRAARGDWVVVMDADLQHPPRLAPQLVEAGAAEDVDVVVASRYTGVGDASGLDGASRRAVSSTATTVARGLFPRRLRPVTDPMSGFFAVRRAALDPAALRPHGFKILLELLLRLPHLRVTEVPFTFERRFAGESKASLREGVRYLRHLGRLRLGVGRAVTVMRATRFAVVGASGIAVNAAAMWLFVTAASVPYLLAAAIATQFSTTWNWALTEAWVFPGAKPRTGWQRFLAFSVVNNVVLLLRLPVLALLVSGLGLHYLLGNVITLATAFAVRFVISDRAIYAVKGGTE